jgi:hypothetical protein
LSLLTDDYLGRLHVTFNLAVDLRDTAADDFQPLLTYLPSNILAVGMKMSRMFSTRSKGN